MLILSLAPARLSSSDLAGITIMVIVVVGIVASVCTVTAILVLHKSKVKYSSTSEPPSKSESNYKLYIPNRKIDFCKTKI